MQFLRPKPTNIMIQLVLSSVSNVLLHYYGYIEKIYKNSYFVSHWSLWGTERLVECCVSLYHSLPVCPPLPARMRLSPVPFAVGACPAHPVVRKNCGQPVQHGLNPSAWAHTLHHLTASQPKHTHTHAQLLHLWNSSISLCATRPYLF